jgi:hypothetical protein
MNKFIKLIDIITFIGISATIRLTKRLAFTDPILVKSVLLILTIESRYNIFFRHL